MMFLWYGGVCVVMFFYIGIIVCGILLLPYLLWSGGG